MDKIIASNNLSSDFHSKKRTKFIDLMPDNSLALFAASDLTAPNFDKKYGWTQNAEFYYLTGIEEPGCFLVLIKNSSSSQDQFLFTPEVNPHYEQWEGRMLHKDQAKKISGIEQIKSSHELDNFLNTILYKLENLYIQNVDYKINCVKSTYNQKISDIRSYFPTLQLKSSTYLLNQLRWKKDTIEIDRIKQAISITKDAILKATSRIHPEFYEYQIEALLNYSYQNAGCARTAFRPIVASGINATILHYAAERVKISDSDSVLIDTGAEWGRYAADVTRVFPAGDKFSTEASDIYSINLEIHKSILKELKPKMLFSQISEIAKETQIKALIENKIIKSKDQAKLYTVHNIGHPLGLDVHDLPSLDYPLTEGCVITIEPGLYFPDKKIGVRVEDDILFTENGISNLTQEIPIEIADLKKISPLLDKDF